MPIIHRIDLKTAKIETQDVLPGSKYEFFAGRSLSSKIITEEVPHESDPLGKENKLIIAPGFLTGTRAPNSGRLSIGGKSPLTGGVKEANVGGRAPAILGNQDIRALVLENQSPDWVLLKVENGRVTIIPAADYVGLNNYALAQKILETFGKNAGAFLIGCAGERLYRSASIASIDMEGYPSRHAARGGLGAVMGSKKVKAIVVIPSKPPEIPYVDRAQFNELTKNWFEVLNSTKRVFAKFGTAIGVMTVNEHNGLPTQNFRMGRFDRAANISGERLNEYIVQNNGKFGIGCSPGCAIRCSNLVKNAKGEHLTSSLEYETIALTGSNLLIDNIEHIALIDQLCDDLGIDSIEAGNTLAVFMEAGIIPWGDGPAVIKLLEEIKTNGQYSEILGNGCYLAGQKLGVKRVSHSMRQGFPGYDPRTFKGMGVTYCTSPMGADHTAGPAIVNRKAYANREYGTLHSPEHKVELSKELQIFIYLVDSMGLCYFVGPSDETTELLSKILAARYGWTKSAADWIAWAKSGLMGEVAYVQKSGWAAKSENLPAHILEETLPDSDHRWNVSPDELKNIWNE
jgi:aldehyde:ferredoxin oxidoreductase